MAIKNWVVISSEGIYKWKPVGPLQATLVEM